MISRYFTILLFCVSTFSLSQPLDPTKHLSQYNLDRISNENIPAGILKMMQSSDGYLWMASHDNLIRFDGVKVTIYNKFNTPEFTVVNGFRCIHEDAQKNIWAGSDGVGLFLKTKNSFRRFEIPFGPGSNHVETVFNDSKGNLWLCTLKGLVLFKDSVFTLIKPKGVSEESQVTIFDVDEDKNGNLWAASSMGVLKYSNGELQQHQWPKFTLDGEILSICVDSEQNIWIGSYGNGVYKATENDITKILELGSFGRSVSMMEDRNHNIWIGTETGIARYGKNGISILDIDNGVSNVTAICEDHEGSVWLGTYYTGLFRLRDGTFTNYSRSNGLPHSAIHSIYQTKDGTIWVGTEINFATFKNGKFEKATYPDMIDSRIRDITSDSQDNIWISTYNGLFKLKGKNVTHYTLADGLPNERVRLVYEDNKKRLWVGTRNGLARFENNRWRAYKDTDGLANQFILSVNQLRNGNIVIGTNTGLFYYDENKFHYVETNKGHILNTVFRTYEDADGYLWIGTNIGLMCIKDGKLYSFTSNTFLGNVVFQVLEDHLGNLWFTSSTGIFKVPRKILIDVVNGVAPTFDVVKFNKSNGMPTSEVTSVSKAFITNDKRIWFPTVQGVAIVDPANIVFNQVAPPIRIEEVVADEAVSFPDSTIVIPPLTRDLEIHYTGLSFMAPDKVHFRYKLDGYDDEWHDVHDRRTAFYSSLPPGSYTFMIEAANNDDVWSRSNHALILKVEKAYWQTWWFIGLVLIGMTLTVYGLVSYRISSIKELNQKLDQRVRERTDEVIHQKEEIEAQRDSIEKKNVELEKAKNIIGQQYLELQEVNETLEKKVQERTHKLVEANEELDYFVYKSSHDIKGPLARLHGLANVALMETKDEPIRKYLSLLQRESILANRVIQKLSYANQIRSADLVFEEINLSAMLDEIIQQLGILHKQTDQVDFKIKIKENLTFFSDPRWVKEILVNLIENTIVFQSHEKQFTQIEASIENNFVHLKITDNGIGIEEDARKDIFKMFFKASEKSVGLGLGLYIVRRATEKLGGTIELNSTNQGLTQFDVVFPANLR